MNKNKGTSPWIGTIPNHWKQLKLRQILFPFSEKGHADMPLLSVVRERGVIVRDTDNNDENHNFIPDDLSGYKLVKKGQFAMNKMKAWQGSYGISRFDGIVSPAYFVFDINYDINKDFFNFAIRSKVYVSYFGQASDGIRVGQWDLSLKRMKEIPFAIPPRDEQDQIVRFLDWKVSEINYLISNKQKVIDKLQELKRTEIQNILFDTNRGTPKKRLKNIATSFGRIGFRGYGISDIVAQGSGAITTSPSNIGEDYMNFDKCTYLSWKKYNESPEIQLCNEDILLVKTGSSYGKTGFIESKLPEKATINPQIFIIRARGDSVIPKYLYYSIKYGELQEQIHRNVIGSTIPTISEFKVMSMNIRVPTIAMQNDCINKISKIIREYIEAEIKIKDEIKILSELKTKLISDTVTGQIDVRDIEIPEYERIEEDLGEDADGDVEDIDVEEKLNLSEIPIGSNRGLSTSRTGASILQLRYDYFPRLSREITDRHEFLKKISRN